jgi:hypothetical protein
MIHRNIIIWVIMIVSFPCSGLAAPKEFVENDTYNAGEADSKLTCRTVSLLEIKGIGRRNIEKAAELGNPRALKWLEEHPGPMGSGSGKQKS